MPMADKRLLELAREARDHAEEVLVKAEAFEDENAKRRMREVAVKYEELAERLEREAGDQLNVPSFQRILAGVTK